MKASRACFIFIFELACAAGTKRSAGPVTAIDLSERQAQILAETLDALAALPAADVVIAPEEYETESTFERTFAFPFEGSGLLRWWTKRIKRVELGDPWTVAVYGGADRIVVREDFFTLPLIDRFASLVHEARHADGGGYQHVECPPEYGFGDKPACDAGDRGAYAHQAALMFELYARGLIDPSKARKAWREARRRVLTR